MTVLVIVIVNISNTLTGQTHLAADNVHISLVYRENDN